MWKLRRSHADGKVDRVFSLAALINDLKTRFLWYFEVDLERLYKDLCVADHIISLKQEQRNDETPFSLNDCNVQGV